MLDWLRLLRASGLATIGSNLLAAVFIGFYAGDAVALKDLAARLRHQGWGLIWIPLASSLLYAAGMLWNDLCDFDRDRILHPRRPLPSGRIGLLSAYVVGALLLVGAFLAAAQVRHGLELAGVVASLILLYDMGVKQVPWLGSLVMALVRAGHAIFALLLLGPDYLRIALSPEASPAGMSVFLAYPAILGLWILGLTLVSELESRSCRRVELVVGLVLMAAALVWCLIRLITAPWLGPFLHGGPLKTAAACAALALAFGLLGMLGWSVGRPAWLALGTGRRGRVRPVVAAGLGGMILLDAVAASAAHPLAGLIIAAGYPVYRLFARVVRMD